MWAFFKFLIFLCLVAVLVIVLIPPMLLTRYWTYARLYARQLTRKSPVRWPVEDDSYVEEDSEEDEDSEVEFPPDDTSAKKKD
jgi:hypothetical protein